MPGTHDLVAQHRRGGIDEAALHAGGGGDKLALALEGRALRRLKTDRHVLERLARVAAGEVFAPAHGADRHGLHRHGLARGQAAQRQVEPAVGRQQRRHRHAARRQQRHPGTVGAQAGPAAAAQGEQHPAGPHPQLAGGAGKPQGLAVGRPAQPAVAHVELHRRAATGRVAQALQPGAQQRRGLHVGGKHATGRADKGFHTQPLRPGTHLGGAEVAQQRLDLLPAGAVALGKAVGRLAVREVEPPLAGQQELAADRGHGVEQVHGNAGVRQHFSGHETGGAATDDGDRQVEGWDGGGVSGHVAAASAGISMSWPCGLMKARRTGSPGWARASARW